VEDVSSLRVNIWINKGLSLLELFKAEKNQDGEPQLICDNCDSKKTAKARCFSCEKYMCNTCVDAHARMSVLTGDHKIMALSDINVESIPVPEKLSLCSKHKGKKLKLFCEDCKVLICKDCTLIDHKDHEFSFIADVAEKYQQKLQDLIDSANKTELKIKSALNTVKDMEERVRKNSEDIEQEIDTIIDAKIKELEEKRSTLKQESRNITALKKKRLSAHEDGLLMHSVALKSAAYFTENLLKNGNTSDILSMVQQLTTRMIVLSFKCIDNEVDTDDRLELNLNEWKPLDFQGFLRLRDPYAPDPKLCCLSIVKINGKQTVRLDVRNSEGRFIKIKQNRVFINCPFTAEVVELLGLPIGKHLAITGKFQLNEPSGVVERSLLRSGELETLIDGQPIFGSPAKVWCY